MVDVIRCEIICLDKKEGKIVGMKIKCPDENEAYHTIEKIYQLQAHRRGASSQLPEGTRGGIQDFFIRTVDRGSTLMLIDNVNGELQIVNPNEDKIDVPECD